MTDTICNCGGIGRPHSLGAPACKRERVTHYAPRPVGQGVYADLDQQWLLKTPAGSQVISGFSLFQQRCYAQHSGGVWSRPKSRDSLNSITA